MGRPSRAASTSSRKVGVLVAGVALLEQGLEDETVDGRRDGRVERARRLRGLSDVLIGHGQLGIADEGRPTGQQLIEQAGGRREVVSGGDVLSAGTGGGKARR